MLEHDDHSRFNGFHKKPLETVGHLLPPPVTSLKRGVNERRSKSATCIHKRS
jgi:hypothetical protein